MHQVFLYISSLFLHDNDVKLPTFTLRRAKTSDDEILFIFLNLNMGHFFDYVIQLYFGGVSSLWSVVKRNLCVCMVPFDFNILHNEIFSPEH